MQYQPNAAHGPHGYLLLVDQQQLPPPDNKSPDNNSPENKSPDNKSPDYKSPDNKLEIHKPTQRDSTELVKLKDSNELPNPESQTGSLGVELDEGTKPKKKCMEQVKNVFKSLSPCASLESTSVDTKISKNSIVIQDISTLSSTSKVNKVVTKLYLAHMQNELECLEVFYEDSFTGGSCLKINPSDVSSPDHRTIRLFYCDFFCEDTLIVCFVTKRLAENPNQYLNVLLHGVNATGDEVHVDLIGRNVAARGWSGILLKKQYPCSQTSTEFRDLQQYILLNHPDFYVPTENSFDWKIWLVNLSFINIDLPITRRRVCAQNCPNQKSTKTY